MSHQFEPCSADIQSQSDLNKKAFLRGVVDILPLSIAVLPWGILAGSMAINAGLTFAQAFRCQLLYLQVLLNW